MSWAHQGGILNSAVHAHVASRSDVHKLPATGEPMVTIGNKLAPNVPLDNQNITATAPNPNTLRGNQHAHKTGIFSVVSVPAIHVYAKPDLVLRQAAPAVAWSSEEERNEGVMYGERLLYKPNIQVVDFYQRNGSKTAAGQEETFYCTGKGPEKCIFCRKPQTAPSSAQPPGNDVLVDSVDV